MKNFFKRSLRYSALAVAILFIFWVIGIAVVYFLVDAESIKKFAVKSVNENTRGELSMGEIKLKVFPLVHFEIKDLAFKSSTNFERKEMFSCKKAKLSFNLFTLILGKPRITLRMDEPGLNFISDGKTNNITDAFKSDKKSSVDVLSYLFVSKFSFDINGADLQYKTPKESYSIKGLDLNLDIDPVSRELDLKTLIPVGKGRVELTAALEMVAKDDGHIKITMDATSAEFETKALIKKKGDALKLVVMAESNMKDTIEVKSLDVTLIDEFLNIKGKVTDFMDGSPSVDLSGVISKKFNISSLGKVLKSLKEYKLSGNVAASIGIKGTIPKKDSASKGDVGVVLKLDASKIAISNDYFVKEKDIPMDVLIDVKTDLKSLGVQAIKLSLYNDVKKNYSLNALLTGDIKDFSGEKPILDVALDVPSFSLSYFAKFFPMTTKYPMAGTASLKAKVTGANNPIPVVSAELKYNDPASKNNLSAKLSNSEKTRSVISADLSSSYIDLNPYLPKVATKAKKGKNSKAPAANKGSSAVSASEDETVPEEPKSKSNEDVVILKKETIASIKKSLATYSIKINSKLDKVVYKELTLSNFIMDGMFSKNEIALNKINLGLLQGTILGNIKIGLTDPPSYKGKLDLKGVKVKDAAGIFMPDIKGVVDGVVSTSLDLSASGYTVNDVKKTMISKGDFAFNNFRYSAQELDTVVHQKLADKLGKLAPPSDKKIFGTNPGWNTIQGAYSVKDGKINIEKFLAKEAEYEATGKGELTFDEYMDMYFDVTVPYKNIPYEGIKVEGKDRSLIVLHLTGPILKPKFDAAYFIKYFADKALQYETKKLKDMATKEADKLKQQAQAKAQAEVQKAAEPVKAQAQQQVQQLQNKLKDAFKGLKF